MRKLFAPGSIELIQAKTDRATLGGIVPLKEPLASSTDPLLAANSSCERQGLTVFTLDRAGEVTVGRKRFSLANRADIARAEAISARLPAERWGSTNDLKGPTVSPASASSDCVSGTILTVKGGWTGR